MPGTEGMEMDCGMRRSGAKEWIQADWWQAAAGDGRLSKKGEARHLQQLVKLQQSHPLIPPLPRP